MAEYIEREKLLERIDDIWDCADMVFETNDHCCHDGDCEGCKWAETKNAIRKIVANFPAAVARPVVTCADCKFWDRERISCEGLARCNTGESGIRYRSHYDFCSRGEKREES